MKTFDQALEHLLNQAIPTVKTKNIAISKALGKTLAENIVAMINVPAYDNSMMDGYALNLDSLKTTDTFSVSQRIAAGNTGSELATGTIARIFTGAVIPAGANAVIMQEETQILANQKVKLNIEFFKNKGRGVNIRRTGEDIAVNETILKKGKVLQAQDLGLIASIGIDKVKVYQPLTVATFTTGNELLEPNQPPEQGKIFNSNRYMLAAAIAQLDFKLIDLGIVDDTLEATINALTEAANVANIVITTGGVSVGEEDHIKPAIEQLGVLNMWKVQMKPGKPLAYGYLNQTPFIGLPGNPVSAFATFKLFAAAYLKTMQGQTDCVTEPIWLIANFNTQKVNFRREFARAKLVNNQQETCIELYPNQGSGVLSSTVWADGLVVIPENTIIRQGDKVAFYHF
jgi:molybdopterin molybdotransferase